MKRGILTAIVEIIRKMSKKPWASFETSGPDKDGRVAFTISCNKAFIERLKKAGYQGDSEEELVQLFFISSQMLPEHLMEDDSINPAEMPKLTSEANILKI